MKTYLKIIISAAVLFLSAFVWYSPVLFKGYPPAIPGPNHGIARSLAITGKFSQESEKNIILNSGRIKADGAVSSTGDKGIALASAALYKIFGLPDFDLTVLLAAWIFALSLFFFFLTVWNLFDYKMAVIFAAVYVFLPVVWETALQPGFYEFSLLFLSMGLFLFFCGWNNKYDIFRYCLSGIFLALSFLSRDAVALLAPVLFFWMLLYKRKAILPLFISMILAIVCFNVFFQFNFGKTSNYHLVFFRSAEQGAQGKDFSFYGHLYPDPYTYHYEKESYLAQKKIEAGQSGIDAQGLAKRISNVESSRISLWQHLRLAPLLMAKHVSSLVSLENTGGPLIFLFFCMGLISLFRQGKPELAYLILGWIFFIFIFCSFFALAQRNHVMDFGFVFALCAAIGIYSLSEILNFKNKNMALILITAMVAYHLVLSSHVTLSRIYNDSSYLKLKAYQDEIGKFDLNVNDVIAAPFNNNEIYAISYLAGKSFVKFSQPTVEKLISENKLKFAFEEFGVTKIAAFSPELTAEIIKQTGVQNLADGDIAPAEVEMSPAKSLFMNLVK
ncbi:MAG: hypothetical protein V1667_02915 [bacterium]